MSGFERKCLRKRNNGAGTNAYVGKILDELIGTSVRSEHLFQNAEAEIFMDAGGGEDGAWAVARDRSALMLREQVGACAMSSEVVDELADHLMMRIGLALAVAVGDVVEVEEPGPVFRYYPAV